MTLWGLVVLGGSLANLRLVRVGEADLQTGTFLRVAGPLSARTLFWAGRDRRYRLQTAHGAIKTTAQVANCVTGLFGTIDYSPRLGVVFAVRSTKREPVYLAPGCRAEEVA